MGWIADGAYEHEGWVAFVVDDGRDTGGSCRDGVILFPPSGGEEIVPWDRVVAWRGRCECGWVGPETPATSGRNGWRDCPEDIVDRVFAPAWEEHVAPFTALAELGPLMEQSRSIDLELAKKVSLARSGGASWSQIGREVGLTKQGAQQRWGTS